jgi:3-hydroxyisobutyrate dehydrogenase-like beta-hydroxyacid dehydrogenase
MGKTIAFIGLGNMGSQMAQRLLEAGYTLRVYKRAGRARIITAPTTRKQGMNATPIHGTVSATTNAATT